MVSNGRKDRDVTAVYFSLLDQEDVRKLCELYRILNPHLPSSMNQHFFCLSDLHPLRRVFLVPGPDFSGGYKYSQGLHAIIHLGKLQKKFPH